jgi:hypothetical protein
MEALIHTSRLKGLDTLRLGADALCAVSNRSRKKADLGVAAYDCDDHLHGWIWSATLVVVGLLPATWCLVQSLGALLSAKSHAVGPDIATTTVIINS